jgi:hypothetical protein
LGQRRTPSLAHLRRQVLGYGYLPEPAAYDGLLLVYLHLPEPLRRRVHQRAEAELLYTAEMLRADFPAVEWSALVEVTVELDEGAFHRGPAAVVHGVGRKRASATGP